MFRVAAMFLLGFAAACATTSRAEYGSIRLRPYGRPGAIPAVFSVEQGRIVSPDLDVTAEPDGCLRGQARRAPVELCPAKSAPPPEKAGDKVEQWAGATGNFTLELMDNGSKLRMDGYLRRSGSRGDIPMNATVPLGKGPEWDELRKHPAFLALAATVAGVRGEPTENDVRDLSQQ
jgi:hypothetical protein